MTAARWQRLSTKAYGLFLHLSLVALAVFTLLLVRDNRQLRSQNAPPEVAQLAVDRIVEPVAVTGLDGISRTLEWNTSGPDRLLLVFTTSCPACLQNQVAWRSLHAALDDDVEIIGISLDGPAATQTYREAQDLTFEVVMASDRQAFTAAYGISAVPTTFHIDGDGRIQGVWRGGLSADQIAEVEAVASRSQDLG